MENSITHSCQVSRIQRDTYAFHYCVPLYARIDSLSRILKIKSIVLSSESARSTNAGIMFFPNSQASDFIASIISFPNSQSRSSSELSELCDAPQRFLFNQNIKTKWRLRRTKRSKRFVFYDLFKQKKDS